jgi:N-acetylglucosaminyldiphosphoundecaprenol N-acetyl-beta-D-mannosaminyltransferase
LQINSDQNFKRAFDARSLISVSLTPYQNSCGEQERAVASRTRASSNLARRVYCVLGIPVDAITLANAIQRIEAATVSREVFLMSTPNLNFVVNSLADPGFRESLLDSDLCPPDGAPIIWVARLLGLPIRERVAGADLLDRLQIRGPHARPIQIFIFGGAKGVADAAAEKLNRQPCGLTCVGTMNPGFGGVDEMSQDHMIDAINASGADLLIVSLGAKKGQLWLRRNHDRLKIPIRSHLGAAINFQAGTVKRAPPLVGAWGFEWLWRIKEERHLWRRYREDGLVFLRLLLTRVLPLVIITGWQQLMMKNLSQELLIETRHYDHFVMISLLGSATKNHVNKAASCFMEALTDKKDIIIHLSDTFLIDARFLGLFLMLRKELTSRGSRLEFTGVPRAIERIFRLNELAFLLSNNFG